MISVYFPGVLAMQGLTSAMKTQRSFLYLMVRVVGSPGGSVSLGVHHTRGSLGKVRFSLPFIFPFYSPFSSLATAVACPHIPVACGCLLRDWSDCASCSVTGVCVFHGPAGL